MTRMRVRWNQLLNTCASDSYLYYNDKYNLDFKLLYPGAFHHEFRIVSLIQSIYGSIRVYTPGVSKPPHCSPQLTMA